jgi:hypothetical protein
VTQWRHRHRLLEVDEQVAEGQVRVDVGVRERGGQVDGPIAVRQSLQELVELFDSVRGQGVNVPEDVKRRLGGRLEGVFGVVVEEGGRCRRRR